MKIYAEPEIILVIPEADDVLCDDVIRTSGDPGEQDPEWELFI